MAVTSINDIKEMFEQEVEIVGFEVDKTITLRLRRVSLLGLVKSGRIPNSLMATVVELFEEKTTKSKPIEDSSNYAELSTIIDLICENMIIDPPYNEIKDYLLDNQKMEIFMYAQGGLRQVERFREQQRDIERNFNGEDVSDITQ